MTLILKKNHPNPKLIKVCPVLKHAISYFKRAEIPQREITTDETLKL